MLPERVLLSQAVADFWRSGRWECCWLCFPREQRAGITQLQLLCMEPQHLAVPGERRALLGSVTARTCMVAAGRGQGAAELPFQAVGWC